MKLNKTDDMLTEIHENIKNDRLKLEECFNDIKAIVSADPIAKIEMTENFVRLVDGLTRSNAQLVELAKVKVKKEVIALSGAKNGFAKDEIDDVFGEIGDCFSTNESKSDLI